MTNVALPTRRRTATWLAIAIVAFAAIVLGSHLLTQALFGAPPPSSAFLMTGALQFALAVLLYGLVSRRSAAVPLAPSRPASDWREVGIGALVVVAFAALQLLVLIPSTGGTARADVVANLAQLDPTPLGLLGFLALAVLGALAEEYFFRGIFLSSVRALGGGGRLGTGSGVALTTVLFALSHGYQGWAGIIDTGLFGGLALSLLYVWRRSLIAPMVAHAGWNLVAGLWLWSIA